MTRSNLENKKFISVYGSRGRVQNSQKVWLEMVRSGSWKITSSIPKVKWGYKLRKHTSSDKLHPATLHHIPKQQHWLWTMYSNTWAYERHVSFKPLHWVRTPRNYTTTSKHTGNTQGSDLSSGLSVSNPSIEICEFMGSRTNEKLNRLLPKLVLMSSRQNLKTPWPIGEAHFWLCLWRFFSKNFYLRRYITLIVTWSGVLYIMKRKRRKLKE